MTALRASSLIHNARNRLVCLGEQLTADTPSIGELRQAISQLTSAIGLLCLHQVGPGIQHQEVELEGFFADLREEVRSLCPAHLVTHCRGDFSACLFPYWTFDRQVIRLVVVDALMNAWQFAHREVSLDCTWADGALNITIHDDGPGFPAEILAGGRPSSPWGSGNGLLLAREIASQHGIGERVGRLELTNAGGAVFRLILP